ncbi:MAG: ABC transporter permease [Sandaracinus sp.]|nr:ABC transporter permease [Sandaracinus sp.]MCB9610863.1 ABC transporter permease [Sandaracinus sp.]
MAFTSRAEATPSPFEALKRVLGDARDVGVLGFRTVHYLFRGKREKGAIAAQMLAVGNRSLFFMCVTMGFIGAIIAFQSGLQARKLVPDFSMLGATFLKLLVRDLAVSVGALPLATRVGAGIAAELGSMVVTDQVDAMRMSAADPIDYLVVPRFLACVVMGPVLLCIGGFVAFASGVLVANLAFDVSPHTFVNLALLNMGDIVLACFKAVTYGAAIALVSSQRGLATFGGSEGVGWATTEAVVGSCFAIIVLNLILSTLGFFLLPA